jgi:valyl-tRNA synthetase
MLEKTYQPAAIEARVHEEWITARAFEAGRPERVKAPSYCIVIPPPNVTGSLHMGHALNNTLQDVLCRFERMRGKDVLWQPGTDHAGIATQLVVERQMMERQEPDRRTIGREKFLEKVWAWKGESGGTIINQLKRLGASCDWTRERFTMDEGLSKAVLKVFVDLHEQSLIYRDKRLVNWDPEFQSALSDLEVDMVDVKGNLWHFKYPLRDAVSYRFPIAFDEAGKAVEWEERNYIVVATTRPETMLGDTAVAVHPEDERYKDLVGKKVVLPLVGREVPIVADDYSDPQIGSGAVKITPAHDFNDYQVGKRHNLPLVNIFDARAQLNDNVPEKYRGLDRFAARDAVVADLEALGLVDKIEPTVHAVPHAQRGNAIIEPWLTDQWYVNAAELAKRAIAAVEDGSTRFIPKNWEKTYFEWMRNIQPWCISRQLWWGHQIPAWYGPDGKVFVALDEAQAQKAATAHYRRQVALRRDEDVLDTWFSSALWPFSTLGWPEKTPELARFYPTSALVTGFDIIFFWVARMMMMGLHFMREIPFHEVYIHALVRDDKGQKMSKTKGNVMDPLGMIDQFGADALRFTLAAMAAQGRDIKLSTHRVEGYRNFATKLWNAARFAEMNECVRQKGFDPKGVRETLNRWIAGEVERTAAAVTAGIETYKFNEAAVAIYEFTWGTFCDWYLELAKPILNGDDEPAKAETRATTAWVLDQILKLLHPFMPFITEELWDRLVEVGVKRENLLCLSAWPLLTGLADATADEEIGWLVNLVSRRARPNSCSAKPRWRCHWRA